jgi:hypothetical protein
MCPRLWVSPRPPFGLRARSEARKYLNYRLLCPVALPILRALFERELSEFYETSKGY